MVERQITYLGAGVTEYVFREVRNRNEDEFRKLLQRVGMYRLF